tara:strand:- start:221 stop:424 length:204 start_codon:yes stop_codon:yes gene_type:complete
MIGVTIGKVFRPCKGVRMFMVSGLQDYTSLFPQRAVLAIGMVTFDPCSIQTCNRSQFNGVRIGKLSS